MTSHSAVEPGSEHARFDILAIGETMIRLSSTPGERLETARSLDMRIGGAESNVAIALARLGRRTGWSSILPQGPLGRRIASELQWHGVDTSLVHWVETGRTGTYYIDPGIAPRSTSVVYDRADSAIANVDPTTFDTGIVSQARYLHLTGITPALSKSCSVFTRHLIDAARQAGTHVSFDVNYRSLLWTTDQARTTLDRLCPDVDVLFCSLTDARSIWGLDSEAEDVLAALSNRFSPDVMVLTLGDNGALALPRDGNLQRAKPVPAQVVDRVGAGDAFAAGFLHGYFDDDIGRGLRMGNAMAALKMTIAGDLAVITPTELEHALSSTYRSIIR